VELGTVSFECLKSMVEALNRLLGILFSSNNVAVKDLAIRLDGYKPVTSYALETGASLLRQKRATLQVKVSLEVGDKALGSLAKINERRTTYGSRI